MAVLLSTHKEHEFWLWLNTWAIFLQSPAVAFVVSILGVVIFCGLTAYDTQRIKSDYIEYSYAEGTEEAGKRSVMDALGLYLNFINLFQFLLQFEEPEIIEAEIAPLSPPARDPNAAPPPSGDDDGPKVVSLDQFRKK